MLGFDIPENFRQPYSASNLGDFWQRWHITFSQWLRDYIYIPLGGSKCSPNRVSLNLFITFLICGFGMVPVGGLCLGWSTWRWSWQCTNAVEIVNAADSIPRLNQQDGAFGLDGRTFSFIAISRIFFVTPNLEVAVVFLERMCDFSASGLGSKVTLVYAIGLGWIMNFYGTNFFHALCSVTSKRSYPTVSSFDRCFLHFAANPSWRYSTLPLLLILNMFSSRFPNKFRSTVVPPARTNIIW